VSWPLLSLAVLGLALAAGFAWYERAHPGARVLALVATLAALAVVGRIAFAPLPNVKPTTDIVLLTGFVLGGAPGFAVGAVAAVVSNFFFGQGPWTPWQMVTWGAVGVGGAALARLTRGRLGRVGLAVACGTAGLLYGAVLNFSAWVNFTGGETTGSLAVFYVRAIPFDVAHAVGNVVFCLAFGPAFVRALRRARDRFEIRWSQATGAAPAAGRRGIAGGGAALVMALTLGLAAAPPARAAAPARYLQGAQNPDGGFGGAPGQGSTQLHTGWAALGLAAAGRNPRDVTRGGRSIVDYLRAGAGSLDDSGELERTILILRAAGLNPRSFAGRDLVAELLRRRKADGSISRQVNLTAFGIFALRAAGSRPGAAPVRRAAAWLLRQQNRDGGFGFARRGTASDPDDTGAALQALAAAGRRGTPAARRAVGYLRGHQNADGGFSLTAGGASNAQSTAWAVQGLVAAGVRPDGVRKRGRTPLGYLRSLRAGDGGVRYSRSSAQTPVWVTAQALTALEGKPFPLAPVPRRARASAHRSLTRAAGGTPGAPRAAGSAPAGGGARAGRTSAASSARAAGRGAAGPLTPAALRAQAPLVAAAYGVGVMTGTIFGGVITPSSPGESR